MERKEYPEEDAIEELKKHDDEKNQRELDRQDGGEERQDKEE